MSCPTELRMFQKILKRSHWMHRMCSTATTDGHQVPTNYIEERDPLPVFYKREVQFLLKSMTGFDLAKVFSQRLVPSYSMPKFVLVTDEELIQMQEKAMRKASYFLHMPPVMKSEQSNVQFYSKDEEIAPFLDHKFLFTDISKGVKDRDRLITARDTDGTLRPAVPEERRRCCQIYYPKRGRNVIMPKMFEKEHLENILHENNYRYILDRACVQFEPDNPDFIRVCHRIYDHAAETKSFDALRSTRFFGPMAFYFAWNKNVELLLMDMIQRDLLRGAIDLLQLYQIIHPEMTLDLTNEEEKSEKELVQILMEFCKTYAKHQYSGQLELTIQAYADALETEEQNQQQLS